MNIVVKLLVNLGILILFIFILAVAFSGEKQERLGLSQTAWAASAVSSQPRLVIPKIGVNANVVEGVTLAALAKGPGHFPGTAGPGEMGMYAIAGHRNIHKSRFMYLPRLNMGDEIRVYKGSRIYRYRVFQSRTVLPHEMWVTDPIPGKATIMLLTCIPVPNPTHRYIVFGELEE